MSGDTTLSRWKQVAGRPSLDFVNTVGGRVASGVEGEPRAQVLRERLGDYGDLLDWAAFASLASAPEIARLRGLAAEDPRRAAAVYARALAFREALYALGAAVVAGLPTAPGDVAWLDQEWHEAQAARRLAAAAAGPLAPVWRDEARLDRLLWPLALDAVDLFTGDRLDRLKRCPGDECGWLFLDTSRNGSRQWCDMRDCGNVAKVRRFRRRLREG
jgi:predicted RNA-binding Zn ribbon-like protein